MDVGCHKKVKVKLVDSLQSIFNIIDCSKIYTMTSITETNDEI